MKKLHILIVAIIVIFILTTSLTAMAISNKDSKSTSKTAISNKSDVNISASDNSMDSLLKNPNFKSHGFEIQKIEESVKINEAIAIEKAKESVGTKISTNSKSITTALVKFTDKETPTLPETDINLTDYPVWIITFHEVNIPHSNFKSTNNNINPYTLADTNVVIDANSGNELESFSYASN
jgi:hypothetical protein